MEYYTEQGVSRKDCEQKIAKKYQVPFQVLGVEDKEIGGFMGLFSKQGVQVVFRLLPAHRSPATGYQSVQSAWNVDIGENRQRPYLNSNTPGGLEEEKRKVLAAAGKDYDQITAGGKEAAQQILDSLNEIKNEIKEKIETGGKKEEHSAFARAKELLSNNDFSQSYINSMLERMRKELPLETLDNPDAVQDHLLEWIGESISIFREDAVPRKPRIVVLVGPTGVGKTTTISKLAAIYGVKRDYNNIPVVEVRMITIDGFRIAAKYQLEQTGDIMQIPVSYIDDKQALRKEIALRSEDTDLFLIDTIGKSPKDAKKLGEMKEILEGARGAEFHLVISAGTKTSDIEDIMRQFEPFNYKSIVLTKMDETDRIGNIISALVEKKKSVSFIADGQSIPKDIKRASVMRFLVNLDGFKVNGEKLEKLFPSKEADQFKWR
jgi:flagellar biosynthesis protein FlhF